MLDLLISYLNFFIIAIKYIVKIIAFQPPNPKGYRIKHCENEILEKSIDLNLNPGDIIEILFLLPNKQTNLKNSNEKKKEKKKDDENDKKNKDIITIRNKKFIYKPANNNISDFELVYFENEDNHTKIPAFFFKPKIYAYDRLDSIIIYCHGNSGDIGTSFIECQLLTRNLGCYVLCFEYPGYGLSTDIGNTNEKRSYFNIRQAYKFARYKLNYSPEKIIIYGFSLGTGIAFDLACDENFPTGGIILQSPFLSIIRTIYNFKKTYYFDLFNNCDKAKKCKSKIYFIHGDKDSIVPYIHGRILSKLIPQQFLYDFYTVHGANHNDILKFAKNQIYDNIKNFIKSLNKERPTIIKDKDNDSDLELSSIKDFDIKKSETYQQIRKKIGNGKKKDFNMNSINNNINSNDELNALKKEKENNEQYYNNNFLKNSNSIINEKENLENKEEEKIKNENVKNSSVSKKSGENSIPEAPKFLAAKDIKLNIENHNIDQNSSDSKIIKSKNSSDEDEDISFDKDRQIKVNNRENN